MGTIMPLDAFTYITMLTKLGLPGGDVISLDESAIGTTIQGVPFEEQGAGNDDYALGISTKGTANVKGVLVANELPYSNVGLIPHGYCMVRQANDGVAGKAGFTFLAETDTQTVKDGRAEDVAAVKCGAVDTVASDAVFTAFPNTVTDDAMATFYHEMASDIGYAREDIALTALDNVFVKINLDLKPRIPVRVTT